MPEAVHLGDLLWIWVQPGIRFTPCPLDFYGPARAYRMILEPWWFKGELAPFWGWIHSRVPCPTRRKYKGFSPGLLPTSPELLPLLHWMLHSACHHSIFSDLNPTPFWLAGVGHISHHYTLPNGICASLMTKRPMFRCCSHETLSQFSLSCLNGGSIWAHATGFHAHHDRVQMQYIHYENAK